MVLPIAVTPTLRGKEAIKFQKCANRNKYKYKYALKKEVKQAIKSFINIAKGGNISLLVVMDSEEG